MLSRRQFLHLSALLAGGAALQACSPLVRRLADPALPLEQLGELAASPSPAHFQALNRLTFGPRPEERLRVKQIGLPAWIEEQLAPEALDDLPCQLRLRALDTLALEASDLADRSDKLFDNLDRQTVPGELRQAALIRQVYSRRQLYELMVDFWSDHFNISVDKGDCFFLKTVDDRQVIRPHALGNFGDLLWASAHSPAMLHYLDNQANQRGAPNENYAREIMELHTLGVDGGYSQQDVMELARCLTGWTIKDHFWRGEFVFKPALHDPGSKKVLGMEIMPTGQGEVEQVIEALARHPSTALHLARKLSRRFLGDEPTSVSSNQELTQRAARAFLDSHGQIAALLRVILLDGLAQAQPTFKRPNHFICSALRMLGADTDGSQPLQEHLASMGQSYFSWPTPDGYPDSSSAWMGNLMPRWRFAFALVNGGIKGTRLDLQSLAAPLQDLLPAAQADWLSLLLLGHPLEAACRTQLLASLQAAGAQQDDLPALLTVGLLSSPDFQWR